MLSNENRLRQDKDFKQILSKGKGVFDKVCGVRFRKNGLELSRFAVVVGLKVSKSAVKRNKVRRQYREILRNHLTMVKPGFDVILLTSRDALTLDYSEKEKLILGVLEKAGLLL